MKIVDVRIILMQSKPEIYRDVQAPVEMNLDDFQFVIKTSMPWDDSHLHAFEAGGYTWGYNEITNLDRDTYAYTLGDMIDAAKAVKGRILYTYDFGDDWKHLIKVGKYSDAESGTTYPRLVGAKGVCPPDDIGGIHGYYHALEVLKDPKHPDFEIYDGFLPDNYDPDKVDLQGLKEEVESIAKNMKLGART